MFTEENEWNEQKQKELESTICKRITEEQAESLGAEVTTEEIKIVVFNMKGNKASGSYGFAVEFFKEN